MAVGKPAGECGLDRREDILGRSGRFPNSGGSPSRAGPRSPAGGSKRSSDKKQNPRRGDINRGSNGGGGSPLAGGDGIVTPGMPSPRLLEPRQMRDVVAGNNTTPSGPQKKRDIHGDAGRTRKGDLCPP